MTDNVEKGKDYTFVTTGPSQPRTPAPRRDPAGSTGAFDPVKTTSAGNTVPRAPRPNYGDFIENSMDPVGSTHVHDHIMHGTTPADSSFGVRHASSEYPKRSGSTPFSSGDAGKGTNYTPKGDAGHKV